MHAGETMHAKPCYNNIYTILMSWWRHQMGPFSALLALCVGNSPVPGEFPTQRPVTRSFDVFFDLRLNKRLSIQSWGWWFKTPPWSLWRHCNGRSTYGPLSRAHRLGPPLYFKFLTVLLLNVVRSAILRGIMHIVIWSSLILYIGVKLFRNWILVNENIALGNFYFIIPGISSETGFVFDCTKWLEWHPPKGGFVLQYYYYVRQVGSVRLFPVFFGNKPLSSPMAFPVGRADLGFALDTVIRIFDSVGDYTEFVNQAVVSRINLV